jgi:rhodanese-related sulfurtransferase
VGAPELTQLLSKDRPGTLLIDARSEADFRAATLPHAVNLRLSDIPEDKIDPRLVRFSAFVVFGQNPGSAAPVAIAKRMVALGYEGVSLFEGGVDAWVASGGPTQPGTRIGPPER